MNIGIDIDDTISDTYEVSFNYAQKFTIEELNKSGKIKKLTNLQTHMYCTDLHQWNEQEEKKFFDKYYKTIIEEVQPKKFAVETIKQLKQKGNTINLITARFESEFFDIKEETIKWLKSNNINYDNLYVNVGDKLTIAKKNNIDIFIDDSFKNCRSMADNGIKIYIMDSRVNGNLNSENIIRVYSWPHLYQEITKIKEVN